MTSLGDRPMRALGYVYINYRVNCSCTCAECTSWVIFINIWPMSCAEAVELDLLVVHLWSTFVMSAMYMTHWLNTSWSIISCQYNSFTSKTYNQSDKYGNILLIMQFLKKTLTERYCSCYVEQLLFKYFPSKTPFDELCSKLSDLHTHIPA